MNKNSFHKFTTTPLALLIIAVFFLVSAQFIAQFYSSKIGNTIEQSRLQRKVQSKIIDMDNLAKIHWGAPINYNFFNDNFLKETTSYNFTAFVYSGDSLIAWTDNDYLINQSIDTTRANIFDADNAIVLTKDYKLNNYYLRLCYLLASKYNIQNKYLKNKLNSDLGINNSANIDISLESGVPLYDAMGNILATVQWSKTKAPDAPIMSVIFIIYILGIVFLIVSTFKFIEEYIKAEITQRISKIISLIPIFLFFKLSLFPKLLFKSDIFDPVFFANSPSIDSLGSLLILSVFVLFAIVVLLDFFHKPTAIILKNKNYHYIFYVIFLSVLFISIISFKAIISALIFNSTISFDLTQPTEINHLSIIGLSSIGIWIFIIYLFYLKLFNWFNINNYHHYKYWVPEIIISTIIFLWIIISNENYYAFAFFIFIIIIQNLFRRSINRPKASVTTLFLIGISILISFWLYSLNTINEHNKRKSLLQNVAIDQDPQAEYLFSKISKDIYKDQFLINNIHDNNIAFDSISSYIINTYFRKYQHFDKYDFQVTTCTSDLRLIIQPQNEEILCDSFFYYNLIKFGTLTNDKNLYFLQYGTGQTNYLGLFRFYEDTPQGYIPYTVYVEINSKLKRKGFTKLLSEKAYDPFEKISKYSLATYIDGKRVETYGNYAYPESFLWDIDTTNNFIFTNKNNFNHLVFRQDKHKTFVLSLKIPSSLNKLSPFSYLFLFFGVLFVLLGLITKNQFIKINLKPNFSSRLQITMISIIIISFTVISIITIIYIQKLNEDKNRLQLENLAVALQTEFEHKLSNSPDINSMDTDYLKKLLLKFSKVFDTDINVYKTNGHLLATTRPEIFEYPLLSDLMNSSAYNYLNKKHTGIYIAKENIGGLLYSSAYLPIHNSIGNSVGYLNLPYFAREEFLKKEISSLLMTLMNVYTLIIVLSILVILVVSNYITRPLSMLKQRLQEVSSGKKPEKIDWQGIEEIKTLVDEYNKMIDALALSSEKLAKGERESAWREMAKQVAHEIKNPLTPMKLSIQYLLHSYNENDENNRERIKSLSNTLIEQIDTLSDIATAFSDFAKMPKSVEEYHDISILIKSVADLYIDQEDVEIELDCVDKQLVNIDKNQWIRVFNNLIKNSIQATESGKKTKIKISLHKYENIIKITFSDNGKGIPMEMKDKIFSPNFTTKTKGTGLGLAMVKNIINNSGGEIHFASTPNVGTEFYISIPID